MTTCRPGKREGLICLLITALCISPSFVTSENPEGHSIVKRSVQSGNQTAKVSTFQFCQPWICSCYMDGVYYEPGDTWNKKGDPCILYKCHEEGYFIPDTIGVMFSDGSCKYLNETWSIGCFKYKVVFDGIVAKYRLLEGGCRAENGDCLLVGDRIIQSCDTYECQIDGSCYTMEKVIQGCNSATHGCKMLHSVWHDHCAVYQCVPSDLGSTIKFHAHEVMLWPRGYYGLLKPETGCPNHDEEKWDESTRIHYSEGNNYYSDPYHMDGNHTETLLEHRFCTHEDYQRDGFMPIYQTYWDAGRYCILRFNGTCPRNFTDGCVKMIDFNGNITISEGVELPVEGFVNGTLPDGEYWDNSTLINFCCRYDGKIDEQLILPTRQPFVLFMAENETKCQQVRAMDVEIEYFSFADFEEGFERQLLGDLPKISTSDNNTLIYLCHYKPITCGCVYDNGEYVTLGEQYTVPGGCVHYTCVFEETLQQNILRLDSAGCSDNGACIPENSATSFEVGESCYERKCIRKINPAKTLFQDYWELDVIPIGCKDNGVCKPLNTIVNTGCFETKCEITNNEPKFVMTTAACSYNSTCVAVGTNITTAECVTLQCQQLPNQQKTDLVVTEGGCMFNGKCYPRDGVWRHDCVDYVCEEFKNATVTTFYKRATRLLCSDVNGSCHEMGDIVTHKCWDYQCYVSGHNRGLVVMGGGCRHLGRCRKSKEIWTQNCSNFTCKTFSNSTYFRWSVEYLDPACELGNKSCIASGETITIGCTKYQCRKGGLECGLIPIAGACRSFTGSCVAINANFTYNCATYRCNQYDNAIKLEPVVGGCKYDDKCYLESERWNTSCKTYECQNSDGMFKPVLLAKGCKDGNGGCMADGEIKSKGCHKIKCTTTAYSCNIRYVEAACNYSGSCLKINEVAKSTTNPCESMKCVGNITEKSISLRYQRVNSSCNYNDTCYPVEMDFLITKSYACYPAFCNIDTNIDLKAPGCFSDTGMCIEAGSSSTFNTTFSAAGKNYKGSICKCGAGAALGCQSFVFA